MLHCRPIPLKISQHQLRNLFKNPEPPPPEFDVEKDWNPYAQVLTPEKVKEFEYDKMEFRKGNKMTKIDKPRVTLISKLLQYVSLRNTFPKTYSQVIQERKDRRLHKLQEYNDATVQEFGPDIAATKLVWSIGGSVKFTNREGFFSEDQREVQLPAGPDEAFKIEAIDFSNTEIKIVGLKYLNNLKYLRWVSFENCQHFDNWCLDRVSLYAPNLEYINLKHCLNLDFNALACMYRFKKLICLNIDRQNELFVFACLNLENEMPGVTVKGLQFKKSPKSVLKSG